MKANIFPIRDSLDDSGCRRVNEQLNCDLLRAMSDEVLDEHIGELDQESREKRRSLRITDDALARALAEKVRRTQPSVTCANPWE